MFLYLILGFLLGMIIPFIAGRFGKLIPADPGLLLLRMFHKPYFPKVDDLARSCLLRQKWRKLWGISLVWGIVETALFFICFYSLPSSYTVWGCVFCWTLSVLMVIDAEYWLLPDFFTIPLLLIGLYFSFFQHEIGIQAGLNSAVFGYVLSVVSVLIMGFVSRKPQFGGGDVKMITAVAAWLGILGLNYTLILSFLLFIVLNILPLQRKGAYGPALGTASIIVFFMLYMK